MCYPEMSFSLNAFIGNLICILYFLHIPDFQNISIIDVKCANLNFFAVGYGEHRYILYSMGSFMRTALTFLPNFFHQILICESENIVFFRELYANN